MSELKDMTGTCVHCGQSKIVKAASQQEADALASVDCSCPGGVLQKTKKQVRERLDELIGYLAPDTGWEPVSQKVFDAISEIANHVAEGDISSCSLRVDDTNLKITRNKGKITIERSKTIKQAGSIER